MLRFKIYLIASLSLLLTSCKSEPSLQKYFVENSENKDFLTMDIAPSILNIDKSKLSISQSEALKSFEKMNVLAFKINDKNKAQYEIEKAKVTAILKDEKYQQLMKFGSGKEGASISFVGTDDKIEEFVVFGNQKENGFAVVRVLGKDMNPTSIMDMISVLKESKIDMEQLKPLKALFDKDSIK
jgi:hypothetical protein